jgi:hypothetical protein
MEAMADKNKLRIQEDQKQVYDNDHPDRGFVVSLRPSSRQMTE